MSTWDAWREGDRILLTVGEQTFSMTLDVAQWLADRLGESR